MSFYEQFHAYIAWQDECASEEDGYGSVMVRILIMFLKLISSIVLQ